MDVSKGTSEAVKQQNSFTKFSKQNTAGKITVQQPSLPSGGGAIKGIGEKFQTNEFSGTASLSLPIAATPCRGITPQLGLAYSSGSGNSPWGLGWSLSASAISRKTSKGIPQYNEQDTFLFAGDDLVLLDQQTPAQKTLQGITYNVAVYRSRDEGAFDLIEYWQPQEPDSQRYAFWKVTHADHTISIFGYSDQTKIADPNNPNHIFSWLLEEIYDVSGDHQLYFYKPESMDNVPAEKYELNRVVTANRYIQAIRYGHDQAISESMVLTQHAAVNDPNQWHFEIVFDYGEYDTSSANANPYHPTMDWNYRPDPFSSYVAGFELRTYRRCVQSLLFHRFAELGSNPVLVSSTRYSYQENNLTQLSQLIAVQVTGHQYQTATQTYVAQTLPELIFNYSDFQPSGYSFKQLEKIKHEFLADLDQGPLYTFVDLYGEGIPGILYADGQSTYYQEPVLTTSQNQATNQVNIAYDRPKPCTSFPIQRRSEGADVTLIDITGNGRLDLMIGNTALKGYYEVETEGTWQPFQPFETFPVDYHQPNQQLVDITGNGLADLVQINGNTIRVYPSAGKQGFKQSWLTPMPENDPKDLAENFPPVPVVLEKTEQVWVSFFNMTGGGTSALVRIEKDQITYWPSLGYGYFAKPISMGNVPKFGDDFDTSRLYLVDIDGSGTADLIYLYPDKAVLYLNQSGNQFSEGIAIPFAPNKYDNLDQISFADVYGRGTSCLVLSSSHDVPNPTYWCYDFCQQQKPYLLNQVNNNMGATTAITYGSSVDCYLADKAAGLPWITSLPFPVQVVSQITHTDAISKTVYTSQYYYHHGYYDGDEQEFRGFGRVDRQDTEIISDFTTSDPSYHVPPTFTKTWYHTGAYFENNDLNAQYQKEYWQGDGNAYGMPDTVFTYPTAPTTDDQRLAYIALHGTVLHSEVYGLDGSQWQSNPYAVSQTRMQVKQLQAKGNNRYGIYMTYAIESIAYNYERNPNDPHCSHDFVLAIDEYGHVIKSCAVAYGRRSVPSSQPQLYTNVQQTAEQQTIIRFGYEESTYINQDSDSNSYLLGVAQEEKGYEITHVTPKQGNYFSLEELVDLFADNVPTASNLLGWSRHYYYDPAQQAELPLGQFTLQTLHCRTEFVEFLANTLPSNLIPELQKTANGYIPDSANNCFWNPGAFQAYLNQDGFYSPLYVCDPLHYQDWQLTADKRVATTYTYDPYYLFVYQVTDPLNNQVTLPLNKTDYQLLTPTQIIDENGNVSEVLLDALGRVIATSYYGTENGKTIGFASLSEYVVISNPTIDDIINNPTGYLQQAAAYFYYDDFAWQNKQTPVCALQITARQYTYTRNATEAVEAPAIGIAYSDGFSRILQAKALVDQPGTTVRYWDADTEQVLEKKLDSCWLTSGAVQYNNKGAPVKQYEPFFADTYRYIEQSALNQVGVSDTLYYDALDRAVLVITANGYLSKTLFGYLMSGSTTTPGGFLATELYNDLPGEFIPSSWHTLAFDANDTIQQSPYYQQASANEQATLNELPYNTPVLTYADSLGRVVQSEQLNVADIEKSATYVALDMVGNALTEADDRLFSTNRYNFQTLYSISGQVLQRQSVDAGTQWALANVVGNACYHQDARQFVRYYQYDVLQRPVAITVTGGDGVTPLNYISERVIYGESFNEPELWNLRGQAVVHFDQSGLSLSPYITFDGQPLAGLKALCEDYKNTPDWTAVDSYNQQILIQAIEIVEDPTQIKSIDLSTVNGLEPETFAAFTDYDAVGVIQSTDPDGNVTTPVYYHNGWLRSNQIMGGPSVTSITYNAKGQKDTVVCGNQVTTTYTYEEKTFRLHNIHSVYTPDNSVLQDFIYAYDPVDNVTAVKQNNVSTVFFSNQQVDPSTTYTYDALYRLIQATGREHVGMGNGFQQSLINRSGAEYIPLNQPTTNGQALQTYTENYQYDNAGNLLQIQHIGAAANTSWTRSHTISSNCNQLISSVLGNGTTNTMNYQYDNNGNMRTWEGVQGIVWNDRNNIQTAVIVDRGENAAPDAEYYVYDSGGQRIRKVFEQQNSDTTSITDAIYLGSYEIRRTKTKVASTGVISVNDDWRVIRFMDGSNCAAVWRYYVENGQRMSGLDKNQQRYQLTNHLDSSVIEVDTQGQIITYEEYYPFGGTALIAADNDTDVSAKYYRYSFKEQDNTTGLYYYGMRYYPPWLGRWLNPDPAETIDGLNLYAFVGGNPTTHIDVGGMVVTRSQSKAQKAQQDKMPQNNVQQNKAKPPSPWKNNNNNNNTPQKKKIVPKKLTMPDSPTKTVADATQKDLLGEGKKGRKTFPKLKDINSNVDKNYIKCEQGVFAILKINGIKATWGRNQAASDSLVFEDIGTINQKGPKINFHAEDWTIGSFKDAFKQANKQGKVSLHDFVEKNFPSNKNNGKVEGAHVFSLRISSSPCKGCVSTIVAFNEFLEEKMGDTSFILRVKFLKPYNLPSNLVDSNSKAAMDFSDSMHRLINEDIYVRIQPENSAIKMGAAKGVYNGKEVLERVLDDATFEAMNLKWRELGVNRKLHDNNNNNKS